MTRKGYFAGIFPGFRGGNVRCTSASGGIELFYRGYSLATIPPLNLPTRVRGEAPTLAPLGSGARISPVSLAGLGAGCPKLLRGVWHLLGVGVLVLTGLCEGQTEKTEPCPAQSPRLWEEVALAQRGSVPSGSTPASYRRLIGGIALAEEAKTQQVPSAELPPAAHPAQTTKVPGNEDHGANSAWPMERIELADGRTLMGLIESVDDQWVHMVVIKREPGRRTQLVVRPVERSAVVQMDRLPEPLRKQLQERVAALAFRARIEAARMEAVGLEKKAQTNIPVFLYDGRWFCLESNLPEQMTRRVIVRLEQIFSGYRQLLPPRTEPQRLLKIQVFSSRMEYEEAIGRYGVRLANPALFLPKENRVLAGTELGQFAAQLRQLEEEHGRLRRELSGLRGQLAEKLEELGRKLRQQGVPRQEAAKILHRERAAFENQIAKKLADIQHVDRKNAELFCQLMDQTLRQLYHEAFHAYMENYLFPSSQYQIPLWLQEGLAMLFQEGIVEADTLRLDAISQEAASLIRKDRRQGAAMPLEQLLGAGSTEFLQARESGSTMGNRYYAYAWAVVYYLCQTERLSLAGLEAYVNPAAQGLPPRQRLERLLGMEVDQWEEGWRKFLRTL